MGLFDRLRKRTDKKAPKDSGAAVSAAENAEAAEVIEPSFRPEDFHRSQKIYDRSLLGISTYEIQCAPCANELRSHLYYGELVEMTEGLMTLTVIAKRSSEVLFIRNGELSLSFSRYGESFFTIAKIVDTTIAGFSRSNHSVGGIIPWKYTIQVILCAEPVRHRRKHGRIIIEWDVFYKLDTGEQDTEATEGSDDRAGYSLAKTIDISEGGFKGTLDRQLERDTIINCIVDVGFEEATKGVLKGQVIRCYPLAYDVGKYEMTVRFIEMDASVREFLSWWIEKIQPAPVNSEAVVSISDKGLDATIELIPPQNNGEDLSLDALHKVLESKNVRHGVNEALLKSIAEKPHYNLRYLIARCTPSEQGEDAVLTIKVDMNPSFSPKVNEAGFVDFKELGQIQKVSEGDVLAERVPPTAGVPGIAVTGEEIPAVSGDDVTFPAGENTAENEDGTQLLAATDGFISIIDGTINVLNTYEVDGDVDHTTGNIDHNGIVVVKGDVRQGFSVTATGDVIVHGTVESATVKAGGSLVVQGGCVGENNHLEVDGNAATMFIDGGSFIIKGSLTTAYILNSTVKCGDTVDLVNTGLIRNSHVTAKNAINAKTVGSEHSAADNTVVEVGNDPELLARYNAACEELDKVSAELEATRANVRGLTVMKHKNQLNAKMEETLEFYKTVIDKLGEQQEDLRDKCMDMKEQIDELGYGYVTVSDIAHGGFKVIIGTREMTLFDSVVEAKFRRRSSGVEIVPLED